MKSIVLSDDIIETLAKDKQLASVFNFFYKYNATLNTKSCNCQRDGAALKNKRAAINTLKKEILGADVTALKSYLKVDKLIIYYISNNTSIRKEL